MNASLMKYDYGTFREGLRAIQRSTTIILNDETHSDEKERIINHVLIHLENIKMNMAKISVLNSAECDLFEEIVRELNNYKN